MATGNVQIHTELATTSTAGTDLPRQAHPSTLSCVQNTAAGLDITKQQPKWGAECFVHMMQCSHLFKSSIGGGIFFTSGVWVLYDSPPVGPPTVFWSSCDGAGLAAAFAPSFPGAFAFFRCLLLPLLGGLPEFGAPELVCCGETVELAWKLLTVSNSD